MSAFAAIFRRDRDPVARPVLSALAKPLSHRGPDGVDLLIEGGLGLAHHHAWVTPEEIGERQPLRSGDLALAFDGRLDNRRELISALGIAASEAGMSDAGLVLRSYAAWGDTCCRRLIGPFAFALFDLEARSGLLARDALGDRTLFYSDLGSELVIGSEEAALLAHPRVSAELDEATLARYFALDVPAPGATFFRAIHELEPGTLLRVGERALDTERYWSPPPVGGAPAVDAEETAERYCELLTLAVESRLRSPRPAAILMSGGLDSTSIAALAAESAQRQGAEPPRAVSWVFDELRECDERELIRPVIEHCRLEPRELAGDALGPLPGNGGLCLNPSTPEESPYRRLKHAAYQAARDAGSLAVLSGGSADALYTGYQDWFIDLIRAGRAGRACRELVAEVRGWGPLAALRRAGLGRWLKPSRPPRPPSWLTPQAAARLDRESSAVHIAAARAASASGPRPARSISVEASYSARAGIDLRHPYRDRRLVEFMLSLPAYELYENGRVKAVARRAVRGRLPEAVRTRTDRTLLSPLYEQAMRGPRQAEWRGLLEVGDAVWPRFVRRDWVEAAFGRSPGQRGDAALWNCLAFEIWRRRFDR